MTKLADQQKAERAATKKFNDTVRSHKRWLEAHNVKTKKKKIVDILLKIWLGAKVVAAAIKFVANYEPSAPFNIFDHQHKVRTDTKFQKWLSRQPVVFELLVKILYYPAFFAVWFMCCVLCIFLPRD